jgi:hypothetical protein
MINLDELSVDKVAHVYSGKLGCACGCRGKHTYASKHREWAGKHRGYEQFLKKITNNIICYLFS